MSYGILKLFFEIAGDFYRNILQSNVGTVVYNTIEDNL